MIPSPANKNTFAPEPQQGCGQYGNTSGSPNTITRIAKDGADMWTGKMYSTNTDLAQSRKYADFFPMILIHGYFSRFFVP